GLGSSPGGCSGRGSKSALVVRAPAWCSESRRGTRPPLSRKSPCAVAGELPRRPAHSHSRTPPWDEHVPLWCSLKLQVPSLQRAVAPGGSLSDSSGLQTMLPEEFS